MMRFEQTKDALNHVQSFHKALSQFYLDLTKLQADERVRIALHYLSDHEIKLANDVNEYKSQARPSILNTWFQYTNDKEILKIPSAQDIPLGLSMDDINALVTKLSQELVTLYTELYKQSDGDELKVLFDNLKTMQIQMNKKLSVSINRMMDV